MENMDDLRYSEDGNASRYLFLKQYNDINFFVEDKDKEYQYEEILQRMFNNEYNIKYIFSTGGKRKLIDRFLEFGKVDADDSRKVNIYLADGDFDAFLHKEDMIIDNNFIYLRAYNIENYFIDEDATISFMSGILRKRKDEVRGIIDFPFWLHSIVHDSKCLFLYYCYIQKNYPEIPNVSRNPQFFIDEKTGFKREGAIERFLTEINTNYGVDIRNDLDALNEIKEEYNAIYGESYFELICGKFLLRSLYAYLENKISKKNIDFKVLEWDLIRNFDINKLSYVKEQVISVVS